jgi:DNA-binding CsgD family transcriptional regulator
MTILDVFLTTFDDFFLPRKRACYSPSTLMRSKSLTPREREVLKLVATGMLNKQIAGELGIAEGTVKQHRGRIMRKLGIISVAELVRLVGAGLDVEAPITSALENARRLLLAIAGSELRGGRHLRAALRQITKAIEANERE